MSRVFTSQATGATVYVFSNDHCPPHVSARHRGEGWIAKVQFSFLSDAVSLRSIEPVPHAPTQRAINRLLEEVRGQLKECRRVWWSIHRTACLKNKWVLLSKGGSVVSIVNNVPEAKQIIQATYDADIERLSITFSDG